MTWPNRDSQKVSYCRGEDGQTLCNYRAHKAGSKDCVPSQMEEDLTLVQEWGQPEFVH